MRKVPAWIRPLMIGGGILNFILAALFLSVPATSHQLLFGAAPFLAPQAIQMYGLLLAAFGLGYLALGLAPLNNTAVVLMGLLTNFLFAIYLPLVAEGQFWQYPAVQLWVLIALGWCAALSAVLYHIAKARQAPQTLAHAYQEPLAKTLTRFRTQRGKSLLQLSNERPTLVIFLRHFGSTFCRETLHDLQQQRKGIEGQGSQIVLVHLGEQAEAAAVLEKFKLDDLHHISDPNGIMYNAFGLKRAKFKQLFSWQTWIRRVVVGIWRRHGLGKLQGDGFRMPGVFLISKGEIVRSFRHSYASQRPNYRQLASEQAA